MLCLCHYRPALLKFSFQTDLRCKNSASFFKNTGGEDLFLPWSHVGHVLRPIFMLWLVKIWQVSSGGSFMQHLESWLLWQLKLTVLCQLLMFLTVFFLWLYRMNYSCFQGLLLVVAGLFIGFLVEKCVACQNSVIPFRMASFSFFTLFYA